MTTLTTCDFTFDDEKVWPGFALGSTWNGFDNVAVSKETLDKIVDDLKYRNATPDDLACFTELEPMDCGLYSLGGGFATTIVRRTMAERTAGQREARAICKKWVGRLGCGFHPDTRGADYTPALSAAEITEYDADVERLFAIAGVDPYIYGVEAMEAAGLI